MTFFLAISFGVLAVKAGFSSAQTIAVSALVFAGSAQFAALAVVASGGGLAPAMGAATLMHSRFLAMGIAIAPSLRGGALRRAVEGQAVVDSSWALASRGDGTFDRAQMIGTTTPQYGAWLAGTAVGAFAGDLVGDIERYGLDAVYPTFFVGILVKELTRPGARTVAIVGAVIALCLVPVTPAGTPVLAAALASFVALIGREDEGR